MTFDTRQSVPLTMLMAAQALSLRSMNVQAQASIDYKNDANKALVHLIKGLPYFLHHDDAHHKKEREHSFVNEYKQGELTLKTLGRDAYDTNNDLKTRPILLVPSFINSSQIFDLTLENSFMLRLLNNGFEPVLLDWGELTQDRKYQSLETMISDRLVHAIEFLASRSPCQHIDIIGYCLGGTLVSAASPLINKYVTNRIFIASPWNFDPDINALSKLILKHQDEVTTYCKKTSIIPSSFVQSLFMMHDPHKYIDKYMSMDFETDDIQKLDTFIETENWLNSCPDIPSYLTHQIIQDLYINNKTHHQTWNLFDKHNIFKANCERGVGKDLILAGHNDHIVSPQSALDIKRILPHADAHVLKCGHIGLLASRKNTIKVIDIITKFINDS